MGLKLLFVRFSSIGDVVLTSAAVRCAKTQLPDVEIHFLTKKSMKAVVEANPFIDRFHYLDQDFPKLLTELKALHFDYIIDLHKNFRTFRLKRALGIPSLSYCKASFEKFLLTKFRIDRMPNKHVALRSVETLAPLSVTYDGKGLDYFIPEATPIPEIPENFEQNFVAFVIGATYFTKKMPVDKMIELISKMDSKVVLLGGTTEAEEGEFIAKKFKNKVWNTCGKLSLHQSAQLIKKANVVLTHDTGLMHIASAFSKKIIVLWGGTVPKLQFYPFYPTNSNVPHFDAIVEGLSCQPCSHFGLIKCPKGHFKCMNLQDLTVVNHQIQVFLNKLH